jgi:acyl carrier protein
MDQSPHRARRSVNLGSLLGPLFPELDRPLRAEDSPATLTVWDSLKQIEIVVLVEEAFDIDLTTAEIVDVRSVASLVRILRQRGLAVEL